MSVATPTEISCKELVELVTDYLEEALPLQERTRFELHIASCSGCSAYLRQMRDTLRVARRLSEESLSAGAQQELLRAFRGWRRR